MEYSNWEVRPPTFALLPQVDLRCVDPRYTGLDALTWDRVATDEQGSVTEVQNPALVIASIVFHPCNWPDLHTRAKKKFEGGERIVDHPFTADKAIAAQQVVKYSTHIL